MSVEPTGKEERPSFLKKRSKKLLDDLASAPSERLNPERKSFLVLFFKKEPLASLRNSQAQPGQQPE
jgi:hypothetical protein